MIIENYDAVGAGWRPLLESLNWQLMEAVGGERASELKVLQIKEKFGGLRVYLDSSAFPEETQNVVFRLIALVENLSFSICELCGAPGTTRTPNNSLYGWRKTLCPEHHSVRDGKYPNDLDIKQA